MITIRPLVATDADYRAVATVHNAVWHDEPTTPEQLQHEDASWPAGFLFQRLIIERNGVVAAAACYFENHWQYQPGKYDMNLVVHPNFQRQGIGSAVYNHILHVLTQRGVTSIVSGTREDKTDAVRFLEQRGFRTIMRWARSQLDVPAFDPARYAGLRERLQDAGVTIYSLHELQSIDPDWQRRGYELDQAAGQDAPSPDPKSEVSFEQYVANTYGHPGFLPEGCFAAVDETGRWVGSTELSHTDDPAVLYTPWTCVHRDYRRRGLATALKVVAIAFAKASGARLITASNEENNPMYQINLALGFQPLPSGLTMKKVIAEP